MPDGESAQCDGRAGRLSGTASARQARWGRDGPECVRGSHVTAGCGWGSMTVPDAGVAVDRLGVAGHVHSPVRTSRVLTRPFWATGAASAAVRAKPTFLSSA